MRKLSVAALALVAVVSFAQPGAAETMLNDHAVVNDTNGSVVRVISNDTCVRTKWVDGGNACGQTATVLTDEERIVYFEFNKATLTPAAQRTLTALAQRLAAADDVASAQIVGFADRIGSTSYNERLSARRAKAVKDFLVANGYLNVNVADTRALGESRPVTSCPTNEPRREQISCLSPDRRVEIELTYVDHVRAQ